MSLTSYRTAPSRASDAYLVNERRNHKGERPIFLPFCHLSGAGMARKMHVEVDVSRPIGLSQGQRSPGGFSGWFEQAERPAERQFCQFLHTQAGHVQAHRIVAHCRV